MVTLREKFLGCIAGSWIGSAMGASVEGWAPERIAEEYGFLDRLLPYRHYTHTTDWLRAPGTTEDGIERQKLIATAIIQKQGRIRAQDLVKVWLRDLDPAKMLYKQEPFDRSLLELARAGVPGSELGRFWPFPNVVSVARASHPLALINAGDPEAAADDTYEVGRVYAAETSFGLRWAALYNAAISDALRPDADVDSVIGTALRFAEYRAEPGSPHATYDTIAAELRRAIDIAQSHSDVMAMREELYSYYQGGAHVTYGMSQANEIVCKGLAIFVQVQGDPREAILTAVNFGRDTDCLGAVAGGLAGALRGRSSLPCEWIEQVNEATRLDPYTNNRRTIEETADGLFEAFRARIAREKARLDFLSDDRYVQ